MRNLTGNHFWGRQHNMLSIIAFIGGAAIGGFAVGISAVPEIRRINSRGWEWYHIAENAVSELNLIKDKRSDSTSRGTRTRYPKRRGIGKTTCRAIVCPSASISGGTA